MGGAEANTSFVVLFDADDSQPDAAHAPVWVVWCTDVTRLPAALTITQPHWNASTCFDVTSYTGDVLDSVCAGGADGSNEVGVLELFADNAPMYLTPKVM